MKPNRAMYYIGILVGSLLMFVVSLFLGLVSALLMITWAVLILVILDDTITRMEDNKNGKN